MCSPEKEFTPLEDGEERRSKSEFLVVDAGYSNDLTESDSEIEPTLNVQVFTLTSLIRFCLQIRFFSTKKSVFIKR